MFGRATIRLGIGPHSSYCCRFHFFEDGSDIALEKLNNLECGPIPNVMAALSNLDGALCSMPQSLADAHYQSAVQ